MPDRKRQLRWWERIAEQIASSRLGGWYFVHVASRIDRWLIPASNGRLQTTFSWPTLLLTTTGAKSGLQRTTPLVYVRDGENIVLIASNGGQPTHPAWYHNLRADPEATITLDGQPAPYVAREATGEERSRLWRKAVDFYAGYARYQQRTQGRQIPVMVMVPKTPTQSVDVS